METAWGEGVHIQDLFSDYMYLVAGEEKAALIDTGMGFPGLRQLVERLTDKPVIVLNTHGHLDHIGGNDEFDCIYLHPDDLTVYVEHGMESYRSGVIRAMARDLGVELSEEIMQGLMAVSAFMKMTMKPVDMRLGIVQLRL